VSTLNDLIASIHTSLHSYSGSQPSVTWLTSGCGTSDVTLSVASSDAVMRGLVEIEDELVYVNSSDSNALSLPPFGRGYRGTTAASHSSGAQVTWDPLFPRAEIRRAIDQAVEGLFPTLYQIKTTDVTATATGIGYALPADCESVLSVKTIVTGDPSGYWETLGRWDFDPTSPVGRTLHLFDPVGAGNTVRVVYAAKFTAFTAGTDTLASRGLSESYADLLLYAVTSRMIRFLDPARLQTQAVENLSRASVVQVGDAAKIANQLYQMYQQRLAEERTRLLQTSLPSIHFTR
jgi:hypothetical protein